MLLDPHFLLFEVDACVFLKSRQTDEGSMERPGAQELRQWSLPAFSLLFTVSFSLLWALALSSPVTPPFLSSPPTFSDFLSSPDFFPISSPLLVQTSSLVPLLFPTGNPSEVLVPWELVLLLRGSWALDGRSVSGKLEGGDKMLTL